MKANYKSDKEVIEALKTGDNKAIQYIYNKHYKPIKNWIMQNNGSEADAEDVYQESMVVFYKKGIAGELELNCKIGTYLFAVSKNIWLKQLRKKKSSKDLEKNLNEPINKSEGEHLKEEERMQAIIEEVEGLGDPCKTLLRSFYFKKMDMDSIADLLNYSNGKRAKSQKYKCMQRLRKKVAKRLNLTHLNFE